MKTCLDDRCTFTKTVNMHYKDIKEQTQQLLSSGQGVLCNVSCKNGTLHPKMAIWSAQMQRRFTEGKCQPSVSVCGWDALPRDVWPLLLLIEDVRRSFCICIWNISKHYSDSVYRHTKIRVLWAEIWGAPQRQKTNIYWAAISLTLTWYCWATRDGISISTSAQSDLRLIQG